jgi:hypothetical protein
MKTLGYFLGCLLAASLRAAVSDSLFATGGSLYTGSAVTNDGFPGMPGNVVFDGEHFVAPGLLPNGAIRITYFDTNAVMASSNDLPATGSTPRLALNGNSLLLAWLETNGSPSVLRCAVISNGTLATPFSIASNVANESVSLSGKQAPFVAIWQSEGSNSVVYGRTLNSDGSAIASEFAVSPSAQPQRFPSVDTDGTNHLVCWMEQNFGSNDWRVMARPLANGQPVASPVTVSETNSPNPHPTACSFGTNFLVAWSVDLELVPKENSWWCPDYPNCPTNIWFSSVYGRMVTPEGNLPGNSFPIIRARSANTNISVAYQSGRYLVAVVTDMTFGFQSLPAMLQPLAADGSRVQQPIDALNFYYPYSSPFQRRMAAALGTFCVLEWRQQDAVQELRAVLYAPQFAPDHFLTNLKRTTNGGIQVAGYSTAEYTTNFVHWSPIFLGHLPSLTNHPRLFVRSKNDAWPCMENMRAISKAKQEWALERKAANTHYPVDADLFGPGRPLAVKPICPSGGAYSSGWISEKPTCTLGGHTL